MADSNSNNRDNDFEESLRQFIDARMRGEEPDIDELVNNYPEYEDQIRQKLQSFRKIDALFDTIVQPKENELADSATGGELVGQKIGSFEIVEIIGRGGMGVVYLAHDTRLGRSVAVKSIPADLAIAKTRFWREATSLASLNHPNIAVIHEIIEEKELSYLILEYVPGETLAQRISHKPLKVKEALSIGRQIAEAVAAAHNKGIIHRDLKPGNIKIIPDGRVKVLDFGLAKPASEEDVSQDNTITQAGSIIGTPAYMSPEQIRGEPINRRTDIWSFGCILYEMLTGKRPFEGKTISDTVARTLERQPDWQALPKEIPENVRILLRCCLEKNPNQRLGDIGDVAIEINETLSLGLLTESRLVSVPQVAIFVKSQRVKIIIGTVIAIILSAIAVRFIPERQTQPSTKEIRLVVLPFENLGSDKDEYFANSITYQITSHLAPVRGLSVLSPRTAARYKQGERDIEAIGKKLGVDYVLDGTVQPERPSDPNSPIIVIPHLIRVSDYELVLADTYTIYSNEDLNELLRVQSDLAGRMTQALNVTLLETERRALTSRPTENIKAYQYYQRGNDYFHRSHEENDFRRAIQMYENAVKLDSTFALAFSRLSLAHSWMYWFYDHSEERLTMAQQAVDKAFQINPDLPEAHAAMGRCYYNHLDFDRALEQFAIARRSLRNDSEILSHIGYTQRRQGKFEQALTNIMRALEIDPLSSKMSVQLAATFMLMRKYAEAERYYEEAISLRPDSVYPYCFKAKLWLIWEGNTEKAWAVFKRAPQETLENQWIVLRSIELNVFDGDYPEALDRLSSYEKEAFDTQFYFIPKALLYAQINGLMGNKQLQEIYYEAARNILETKIQEQPDDERFHSSLGIACAGLGRKEDAIREGERGVELLPETKDAWRGQYRLEDLARIYVMVGEHDLAIEKLEYLLSIPGEMSVPLLKLNPAWDPLRNHPRFKKLIEPDK